MLFCYKPPAGIYHSQSWKIYSEESESVNWHTELLWESGTIKIFMSLNDCIELGIMKFWEREGSVTFLLQTRELCTELQVFKKQNNYLYLDALLTELSICCVHIHNLYFTPKGNI